MPDAIVHSLLKRRSVRRRFFVPVFVSLAVLILGALGLKLAGDASPPPRFKLDAHGLLTPIHYPVWRRLSDMLAGRKYIMLTFDDGPYGHGIDAKILAILATHHAHAVFFEVCAHINDATRSVPKQILASGNLLGNHSYDHRHLPKLGPADLQHEIAGCSDKLASITGVRPRLFRPPWGQLSPAVSKSIHSAGMQVVLWDANSGDTWLRSRRKIIQMSLYEASLGGHILLMHSRPTTAEALDTLLTRLQQRGFRFVLPSTVQSSAGTS